MTLAQARDIVWHRLAITAREDGANVCFWTIERRLAKRPPVLAAPKRSTS